MQGRQLDEVQRQDKLTALAARYVIVCGTVCWRSIAYLITTSVTATSAGKSLGLQNGCHVLLCYLSSNSFIASFISASCNFELYFHDIAMILT